MRISIFVICLTVPAAFVQARGAAWVGPHAREPLPAVPDAPPQDQGAQTPDPDALYAQREDLERARRAVEIWDSATKRDSRDLEAAWKLARGRCYLGDHVPSAERRAQYSLGVEAARLAVAVQPNRPEGHFWLGTSLGGLAELSWWAGLKYRNVIKAEYETVVRLDPGWDEGSGLVGLGRWYSEVPSLFGGSKAKSEEYLRRALAYDPYGSIVHYFLAETLLGLDRPAEARVELEKAVAAPFDPEYVPEDKEWKEKARALLKEIGAR